jgi:protease-4
MPETDNTNRSPLRLILLFLLVIIVPLAIGLYAAPRLVPKPKIGILRLNYEINAETAYITTEQMAYARNDPAIKAVVMIINSPGGSAAYSEELFLDVLRTREQLPVVASVDLLAASGAYYTAVAADEIFAKPTSNIGSVGVISFLQGDAFIEEDLLTTGPYKAFGGTRDGSVRQIERAKLAFLEAVKVGRAGKLEIDLDVLSRAEVYTGVQAYDFGMIDGVKSNEEVIDRAAELAGISDYDVVELFPLTFQDDSQLPFFDYQPEPIDAERLWAHPSNLAPGIYYRYIDTPSN